MAIRSRQTQTDRTRRHHARSRPGRLWEWQPRSAYETSTEPRPTRSRVGNKSFENFRTHKWHEISDTQTGLRGFANSLDKMLRFQDHVSNTKWMCWWFGQKKTPFCELEIQTIYENKNEGSHFNPLRDSFRIYKEIFHLALMSILFFQTTPSTPFKFLSAYHFRPLTWSQGWLIAQDSTSWIRNSSLPATNRTLKNWRLYFT